MKEAQIVSVQDHVFRQTEIVEERVQVLTYDSKHCFVGNDSWEFPTRCCCS